MNPEDNNLHSQFSKLAAHDRAHAPAFKPLTRPSAPRSPLPRFAIGIAAALVIAAGTAIALLPRHHEPAPPTAQLPADDVPSILDWQSPTASLLDLHDDLADFTPAPTSSAATRNF